MRYEIIDTVAVGEFTTVYRARDRKLAREVAVKQIHQQYLVDPEQLEGYWEDVRSLGSLDHPHLVTIVEAIPARGWLVTELMRSSLKQTTQDEPADNEFLREVLTACLGRNCQLRQRSTKQVKSRGPRRRGRVLFTVVS